MKICIVGNCGHAISAVEAYEKRKDIAFVGYCPGIEGENLTNLEAAFAKNGLFPVRFENYRSMVEALQPDVLVVDSVFCDHFKIMKYALQNNIHVYCEKPLALTVQDCLEIPKLLKQTDAVLWSMQTMRYDPWMFTAKQLVQPERIGKIRMIHAQKSYKLGVRPPFFRDRAQYGGTIPWVAIHAIDLIQYFSQAKFTSVYARSSSKENGGNGDMESEAVCCFTMENDILAQVNADYYRPANAPTHGDDRIRIVGTKGIVEVRENQVYLTDSEHDGNSPEKLINAPLIFEDFLNYVQNGSGWLDPQQSIAATYVALMARDSADSGKVLELHY